MKMFSSLSDFSFTPSTPNPEMQISSCNSVVCLREASSGGFPSGFTDTHSIWTTLCFQVCECTRFSFHWEFPPLVCLSFHFPLPTWDSVNSSPSGCSHISKEFHSMPTTWADMLLLPRSFRALSMAPLLHNVTVYLPISTAEQEPCQSQYPARDKSSIHEESHKWVKAKFSII